MYESGYNGGGEAFGLGFILVMVAVYFYFSFALFRIAKKTGYHSHAWWSFIPIMNTFLLIEMAGRPLYWFLFLLVPVVNIVLFAILWMDVAKAVGKHPAWGICTLLPFINFVSIGYLAFTEGPPARSFPPDPGTRDQEPANVG